MYTALFLLSPKRKYVYKLSKLAAAKNLFSSMHVIDLICFDERFLIPCDYWKTLLDKKVYRHSDGFCNAMLFLSLKQMF